MKTKSDLEGLPCVTQSLFGRSGGVERKSGLNWGMRPRRDPNQAYIGLSAEICKTNFFPRTGTVFNVITDDGETFTCVRAQSSGKAIETPDNNALMGKYFRKRLNVFGGILVTKKHLTKHGRTHVTFYKISPKTYYMDFGVL